MLFDVVASDNTKIVDIYRSLGEYTPNITIYDPWADTKEVKDEYHIDINSSTLIPHSFDAIVLCVAKVLRSLYSMENLFFSRWSGRFSHNYLYK